MNDAAKRRGAALGRARRAKGLTQADVAARLRVDVATVSRWERGAAEPSAVQRAALDKLFGTPRLRLVK